MHRFVIAVSESSIRYAGDLVKPLIRTLVALAIAAISLPIFAQTPAGDPAFGKAAFMKNMCYTCHGTVGQGGERNAGPKIAPNAWPYAAFAQQVRRPRAGMPRYSARFVSDAELSDLYAYVASIRVGPAANEIPLLSNLR